jgi:hypothetical protein
MASGDKLQNWQIAQRVATTIVSADATAGTYVAETVLATITATLTSGRRYAVRGMGRCSTNVSGDSALYRVREDNVTGFQTALNRVWMDADSAGIGCEMYGEYTAASNLSKTWVLTVIRRTGTGTLTPRNPMYLLIDVLPT